MWMTAVHSSGRLNGRRKGRFDSCKSDFHGELLEPALLYNTHANSQFVACDMPSRTFARRAVPRAINPAPGRIPRSLLSPPLIIFSIYLHITVLSLRRFSPVSANPPSHTPFHIFVVSLLICLPVVYPSHVVLILLFCISCTVHYVP